MSNQPDSPAPTPRATPAAAHPATPFAPAVAPPRAPDHSPSLTPDADLPPPHITDEQRARLDAHGFDPADYDWEPVNKRVRHDGWTVERQRSFIATLADTGSVREAAATVGMSVVSAYALRRASYRNFAPQPQRGVNFVNFRRVNFQGGRFGFAGFAKPTPSSIDPSDNTAPPHPLAPLVAPR